jgi:hypothetical protein
MVRNEMQIGGGISATRYRQFWGIVKRAELEASLTEPAFDAQYQTVTPTQANRYSFRPNTVSADYSAWPSIADLVLNAPMPGLLEKRKGALVSFDRPTIERRMQSYLDPKVSWESIRVLAPGLAADAARFDAKAARQRLVTAESFSFSSIRRFTVLPMDTRWCYHTKVRPIWNEPRPQYAAQCWPGNVTLVVRKKAVANPEGVPFFFTCAIADEHAFLKDAYYVPLMLRHEAPTPATVEGQTDFNDLVAQPMPIQAANLSDQARAYLASLGIADPDRDMDTAALIWRHVLAIGYAPAYLAEHEDGIRADWPRIPLPATEGALRVSAALGKQLSDLLDTEQPASGVTSGAIRPELRVIADLAKLDGTPPNPGTGDFDLRARWGYASKNGIIMGGPGKLARRPYTDDELSAIRVGAAISGLTLDQALERLGPATLDVYLNDRVCWRNIPSNVWDFTIGGYQVIKKWLSYREHALLNRGLTLEEVRHVIGMARRLAAVRLLEPALDANYAATIAATYAWPAAPAPSTPTPS